MKKKICLTGCAGFIGSHVLEALLIEGHDVVGIDTLWQSDLSTSKFFDATKNIREATDASNSRFELNVFDVRDRDKVRKLFKQGFDAIIHLAGLAGVRRSINEPAAYIDVNVVGTSVLLDECARARIKRFVFASSSSVYGDVGGELFEHMPLNPRSPYAASKASAEAMCTAYTNCYDISALSLRFFTAYGPRNRHDMMAYKILENMYKDIALTVFNNGQMIRDWTYVTDIADGIVAAVDSSETGIINLGAGSPVMLSDFITKIEKHSGKRCTFGTMQAPRADVSETHASIFQAQHRLGYMPKVNVLDGTKKLVDWFVSTQL